VTACAFSPLPNNNCNLQNAKASVPAITKVTHNDNSRSRIALYLAAASDQANEELTPPASASVSKKSSSKKKKRSRAIRDADGSYSEKYLHDNGLKITTDENGVVT
jgi:hypothetical protein